MTQKERKQFDSLLEKAVRNSILRSEDICSLIALPLEIEALEAMIQQLEITLEAKRHLLERAKKAIFNK